MIVAFFRINLRLDDPLSKAAYNYCSQVLPRLIGKACLIWYCVLASSEYSWQLCRNKLPNNVLYTFIDCVKIQCNKCTV